MNEILKIVEKAINDKKGEDIILYDFFKHNPLVDHVFVTSASNMRQVYAIADHIVDTLQKQDIYVRSLEGNKDSRWMLVDAGHVIVHVFLDEERSIFKLEKLYADVERIHLPL